LRENLRDLLKEDSGGVVFTTIQKILVEKGKAPEKFSMRENIVVIADEANISEYNLITGWRRASGTPCPTPRSSGSPAHPSTRRMPTPAPSLASPSPFTVTGDEYAFYEALAQNQSAVEI